MLNKRPEYLNDTAFCAQLGEGLHHAALQEGADKLTKVQDALFKTGLTLVRDPKKKPVVAARMVYDLLYKLESWVMGGHAGFPKLTLHEREAVYQFYFQPEERESVSAFENRVMDRRSFEKMGCSIAITIPTAPVIAGGLIYNHSLKSPENDPVYLPERKATDHFTSLERKRDDMEEMLTNHPDLVKGDDAAVKMLEIEKQRMEAKKALLDAQDALKQAGLSPYQDALRNYEKARETSLLISAMATGLFLGGWAAPAIFGSSTPPSTPAKNSSDPLYQRDTHSFDPADHWKPKPDALPEQAPEETAREEYDEAMKSLHTKFKIASAALTKGIEPYLRAIAQQVHRENEGGQGQNRPSSRA